MKTLLLGIEDVKTAMTMKEVIAAVKEGYLAFEEGQVQQPDIVSMEVPLRNGETDIKSCYNARNETISVKVASAFFDNGKENDLPTLIGTILLHDGTNGAPLCVMDGSLITGMRTGAAGAISCELLSREDAETVAVFGGGGQARMQIYGLCQVRNIRRVNVYSPFPEELTKYKEDVERETGVSVTICRTVEETMDGVDIAISTTPSKEVLIPASTVRPGMHIVAVGADMAGKNEWDPEVFRSAKVINDSIRQCVTLGETRNAILRGVINEGDIYGEIGEILTGKKAGRERKEEITIFDTTGMGIQDNVTAVRIYEIARKRGLGSTFAFL